MSFHPRIRGTLRALLLPRRLVPIGLVSAALVAAQSSFNATPHRVPLAIAMCTAFVLVAPVSWRVLFYEPSRILHTIVLWALYLTIGVGVVATIGLVVPAHLHLGSTLLSQHLVVAVALFVAGGWGLGWHIALEEDLGLAARRLEETQLLALRAQLDPHFLFNTLNAIAEWCVLDGAVAERAVLQLSSILRTLLTGVRASSWTMSEELALFEAVCELHRLRDPSLFSYDIERVGDVDNLVVPPMILLPLVDNAIKHGPMAGHRGQIAVCVFRENDEWGVEITNPGPYRGPRAGSEGLPALERRLSLLEGTFSIEPEGTRTRVALVMPVTS